MSKPHRNFDGFDIHGHKLKVSFYGDGVVSSLFVITRSREFSWLFLFFAFFVIGVAVALCKVCYSLISCCHYLKILFKMIETLLFFSFETVFLPHL